MCFFLFRTFCEKNKSVLTPSITILLEYKLNETVNKFSLPGDKFMPEMLVRQPEFEHSACGTFIKNKEIIQKFKETGDSQYNYQKKKKDKAFFQHDMAYQDFKRFN